MYLRDRVGSSCREAEVHDERIDASSPPTALASMSLSDQIDEVPTMASTATTSSRTPCPGCPSVPPNIWKAPLLVSKSRLIKGVDGRKWSRASWSGDLQRLLTSQLAEPEQRREVGDVIRVEVADGQQG